MRVTTLLVLAALLVGGATGWALRPAPQRFLRWSSGPVPYWRADALAEKVALNLALLQGDKAQAEALVALARTLRVVFVARAFEAHRPWRPGPDGVAVWRRVVYVQAGEGWELRLAEAVSQALRLRLKGDADRHGADELWRQAALTGLVAPEPEGDAVPRG